MTNATCDQAGASVASGGVVVSIVSSVFCSPGLKKHPDKTFIGRIARGFDFSGYHFSCDAHGDARLGLARQTIENFKTRLSRLYEQKRLLPHNQVAALEARIIT